MVVGKLSKRLKTIPGHINLMMMMTVMMIMMKMVMFPSRYVSGSPEILRNYNSSQKVILDINEIA